MIKWSIQWTYDWTCNTPFN